MIHSLQSSATTAPDETVKWHLVRIDDGGVPGRQHGIRATGNTVFNPDQVSGSLDERRAAYSFLTLSTSYWHLDPSALYRVRVTYGTTADRPRVQSMTANGQQVHPPIRLPAGRLETSEFALSTGPDERGRLRLEFMAHELPENVGRDDLVADTAIVSRVELLSTKPPLPAILDLATVPSGGVAISALAPPEMSPVSGLEVAVVFADGSVLTVTTDDEGNGIASAPASARELAPGSIIMARAAVRGDYVHASTTVDDTFALEWPVLRPPASSERAITSLNGSWEFRVLTSNAEPNSDWRPIEVPGQWYQQGFDVPSGACGHYRARFPAPAGERCVVRFDAVYAHAEVFVNGHRLGEHEGGFTPFEFEITGVLAEENELEVLVRSDSISDTVSAASDYAAHSLGGITRGVSIVALPACHLNRLHVEAHPDSPGGRVRVFGSVDFSGGVEEVDCTLSIVDETGQLLGSRELRITASTAHFDEELALPSVLPWTAETPTLYRLDATVSGAVASRRFGFRTVSVEGTTLMVNGSPVRLRGVERHEQDPLRGRSTTRENWAADIELMKSANVNNVFTCHYPHAEGFLELCDSEGLWVIDESPTVWVGVETADNPEQFVALATPILEMIERDFSHPSVVIWMLGDECLWGRNFWRLVLWLRHQGVDLPMMFSFDIGGHSSLDIASRHYPPVDFGRVIDDLDKPVTFDQFAHVNCYNRRELVTDPEVRDWWGTAFQLLWGDIVRNDRVLGGQIWAWSDDEFHIDDERVIGYGTWGIVDTWRRPKPEWWNLKMVYSPVRVEPMALQSGTADDVVVPLINQYDFLGLDTVTVEWSTPHERGRARCEGDARGPGSVVIPLCNPVSDGDSVRLDFFDRQGRSITSHAIPVGTAAAAPHVRRPPTPHAGVSTREEGRARLSAPNRPEFDATAVITGDVEWLIDRETGYIRAGRVARRTVIRKAPELLLIPGTATKTVGPHHRSDIEPFTPTRPRVSNTSTSWLSATRTLHGASEHEGARLRYTIGIDEHGAAEVRYSVQVLEDISVRQVGLVVDLPVTFGTLRWSRPTQWSVYPEDHIGRGVGTAYARRLGEESVQEGGIRPAWAWSHDENALGTADFRSTRRSVHWASLTDHEGVGIWVEPLALEHPIDVRVWRSGDSVRLLVAAHSSGGSEPFMAHTGQTLPLARELSAGQVIDGAFRIHLGRVEVS